MEFRKALLRTAGLLALTAAGHGSADAAVSSADTPKALPSAAAASNYSDPLFELMTRTNGSFAKETVETALREMFKDPTSAQAESFPELLASLAGLGAPAEVISNAKEVLIEILSSATNPDEDLREAVLAEIEAEPNTYQLAQLTKGKRKDRDEVGETPEDGPEIGQTPAPAS